MKIAIVIGHEPRSPGAYSKYLGLSEYIYNSEVAASLSNVADIYRRPLGRGYTSQMITLSEQLKRKNYDLIIELHFNSFNSKANGTETVTYKGNSRSKGYGKLFNELIVSNYGIKNRGQKEVDKSGRGGKFLYLMPADAIILEPFFGDHPEAEKFKDVKEYACIIKDWLLNIKK